jgi:hypothetical protein
MVLETSVLHRHPTPLIAREDFTEETELTISKASVLECMLPRNYTTKKIIVLMKLNRIEKVYHTRTDRLNNSFS